jgi:hypothetical protein
LHDLHAGLPLQQFGQALHAAAQDFVASITVTSARHRRSAAMRAPP